MVTNDVAILYSPVFNTWSACPDFWPDFDQLFCQKFGIRSEIEGEGMELKIIISKFQPLGEGFQGFGPQIRLQHAEISPGTNSEVIWLELKLFPIFFGIKQKNDF